MRVFATLLCAAGCVLVAVCGSIGEPMYPALNIPAKITDLVAVERGDKIAIYFTVPSLTTDGPALRGIGSVDLRVGVNPAGGFDREKWAASAKRIDLPAPSQPGPIHEEIPAREFIGKEIVAAVRVGNRRGRMSEWS